MPEDDDFTKTLAFILAEEGRVGGLSRKRKRDWRRTACECHNIAPPRNGRLKLSDRTAFGLAAAHACAMIIMATPRSDESNNERAGNICDHIKHHILLGTDYGFLTAHLRGDIANTGAFLGKAEDDARHAFAQALTPYIPHHLLFFSIDVSASCKRAHSLNIAAHPG